jgi:hypothetical protein
MKSTNRLEKLRNGCLNKLLSNKNINDRTLLFAKAKSIFDKVRINGTDKKKSLAR